MIKDINTYGDLLAALQLMTKEQLEKRVQVLPPNPDGDKPTECMPVYCICTVESGLDPDVGIRSSYDNKNHLDDIVICADWHPFDENGSIEGSWD